MLHFTNIGPCGLMLATGAPVKNEIFAQPIPDREF
jgi:hypothetical protein